MAKRKKAKAKTRRCSVCRSTKHDKRGCKSKLRKRKSRKTRRRRKNPGLVDSVAEMGLSYDYSKKNPCEKCGCTCKDIAAGAARYLRKMRRRNPCGSGHRKTRWNPCGSRHRKPSRRWNCGSRENPWLDEDSVNEPLNKRIRRLCRSDLTPYEISNYMNVPASWVADVCQTERRYDKNPSTTCSNCGTGNRSDRETCWKCGFDLAATPEGRMAATRRRAFRGSLLGDIY